MTDATLISLIDRLRALPTETECVEFKRNRFEAQELGEYFSALANSACLAGKQHAYLLFGVDNDTHELVGTTFDPYAEKAKGNQDLLIWLNMGLQPRVGVEAHIVEHPDGRVVLFKIGAAREEPVSFYGTAYIRVGSSKTELSKHPEKARAIWSRGRDWSAELCEAASMGDLDPGAILEARKQFITKNPGLADAVKAWDDVTFLNKAHVLKQGSITHSALLLLGRPESSSLLSPAVAKILWNLKDAENRELDYEHFAPPFLLAGDRLLKRIRNLIVRAMPSGTLFPQEISQYDPWVIREALHNCIAHQDYGMHGRIAVVEFPDRILLDNVGDFIPGDVNTVLTQDAPQAIYRNPFLANAMTELNMIDTRGGGIKKMYETQWRRSFPMPDFDLSQANHVSVTISGRILDERYTRLLMERPDLKLAQVMLLDMVQKKRGISKEEHRRLKADALVEGRYPNLIVAAKIAKVTGETGRHIRERGFDKQYYMDLILALVKEHGPVDRKEINDLLLAKLPDRLTPEQKESRVHNLMQELRRAGRIQNQGSRSGSRWVILDVKEN